MSVTAGAVVLMIGDDRGRQQPEIAFLRVFIPGLRLSCVPVTSSF